MGGKERKARETWEEKKHKWGLAALYAAMLLLVSYAFGAFCFFVVGGLAAYAGLNIGGLYFLLFCFYLGTVFGLYQFLDHLKAWPKSEGDRSDETTITDQGEQELYRQPRKVNVEEIKAAQSNRLGEMLVKSNLVTEEQLKKALAQQSTSDERLGSILVKMGYISEEDLANFLSRLYGVPFVNLEEVDIDPKVIKLVPVEIVQFHTLIPIKQKTDYSIEVAFVDPNNMFAIDDFRFLTGLSAEPLVATETQIRNAINRYYHSVEVGPRDATA